MLTIPALEEFQPGVLPQDEFEDMVEELVHTNMPDNKIEEITYTEEGVKVLLDDDQVIEIEVDWDETILV